MIKQPFKELIPTATVELRRPNPTMEHAENMYELLRRNNFFYPRRLSLRNLKSPADCLEFINARLEKMNALTDVFYDIFKDGVYIGEIYARDIDHNMRVVKNLGYFIDEQYQGNGIASDAVNALTEELFKMGAHRICLFVHFFDAEERNIASEKVAEKCGFAFEGIARDAIYDPLADRYASERMFSKLSNRYRTNVPIVSRA